MHRSTEILVYGLICSVSIFLASGAAGAYMLANKEMDETRDERVKSFNDAVDQWQAGGEAHWISLSEMTVTGLGAEVKLVGTTLPSNIADRHADLEKFEEYVYKGTYKREMTGWADTQADLYLEIQGAPANPLLVASGVKITKTDVHHTTNWKNCDYANHGSLDATQGLCYIRQTLSSVYIGLVHDGNYSNWRVASEPEFGYRTVKTPRYESEDTSKLLRPVVEASFTVRAAGDDPFLVAKKLTGGTTEFGMDSSERVFLGVFLIVLSTCSLFAVFFTIRASRNARKQEVPAYTRTASCYTDHHVVVHEDSIQIAIDGEVSPKPSRPRSVSPSEIEMDVQRDRTDV